MEYSLQEGEGGPCNLGGTQNLRCLGKQKLGRFLNPLWFHKRNEQGLVAETLIISAANSWTVEPPASCVESSRVSVFLSGRLCWYGLFSNTGAFEASLRSSPSLTLLVAIPIQTHRLTMLRFLFFFPLVLILLSCSTFLTTASPSLHSS